jgi:hypothetical protein
LKAAMLDWGQLGDGAPMASAARNGFAILISGVATSLEPIDVAVRRASQAPELVIDPTLVEFSDDDTEQDDVDQKVPADA